MVIGLMNTGRLRWLAEKQPGDCALSEVRQMASALRSLIEFGSRGFIVSESCGPEQHYEVRAKFRDLESMQGFYAALVECGMVGKEMANVEPESPCKGQMCDGDCDDLSCDADK